MLSKSTFSILSTRSLWAFGMTFIFESASNSALWVSLISKKCFYTHQLHVTDPGSYISVHAEIDKEKNLSWLVFSLLYVL